MERTFCWVTMGWEEGVMDEVVGGEALFTLMWMRTGNVFFFLAAVEGCYGYGWIIVDYVTHTYFSSLSFLLASNFLFSLLVFRGQN